MSAGKRARANAVEKTYRSKAEEARAALRAATRANARLQAVAEEDELETLEGQLDELDAESDLDHTEEFDIIKNRCRCIQVQSNLLSAEESNKPLTFTCPICFDNYVMHALRIITPCGHGFCFHCMTKLKPTCYLPRAAEDPEPDCPTCRGPIASVIKAHF